MNKIIKTWLIAGLIVGVAGTVLFSLALIVKLGRFEDIRNKTEEMETQATKKSAELSALQVEMDTLNKQKEILNPRTRAGILASSLTRPAVAADVTVVIGTKFSGHETPRVISQSENSAIRAGRFESQS